MKRRADGSCSRRWFALQLAGAVLLTPAAAKAAGIRALYGTGRPALPGMGPSLRRTVDFEGGEPPGTIVIDVKKRALFLVTSASSALRYKISVGRDGFGWSGHVKIGAKREWPDWRPPAAMLARDPSLPESVPPGPYNPLGARALYLFRGGRDTLYRIHGTNHPGGVGSDGTSGCFRLTNTDIVDLFNRVRIGTEVIVR
jgi:lipoprotein-anchoring transpeptidase ErfK/SrfK